MLKRFVAPLLALVLLLVGLPVSARDAEPTLLYVERIERYKGATLQGWLDGELTDNAGKGAEWYVTALIKRYPALNFTRYEAALREKLEAGKVTSPVSRINCALVLACLGSSPDLVGETLDASIGKTGMNSWIYGLHLLNAGAASAEYSAEDVVSIILGMQNEDGGWSYTGNVSDVDITAMTLQALAPNRALPEVNEAIGSALSLLVGKQLPSGGFRNMMGDENVESTAMVLLALSCLGTDASTAGFEGGYDRMLAELARYATDSGGFSHKVGGDVNETATSQVYLALSSVLAARDGKSSVFLPDVAPDSFHATESERHFPFAFFYIAVPVLSVSIAVLFVLHRKKERAAIFPAEALDDTPDGEPK